MNPTQLLEHFDRISEAPDAIPRLRRFILDLAVRGKLVEQDPNDEPAAELIKRIRAEKEKLANSGEIRSKKPLRAVSKDEVPSISHPNWIWDRLGNLSTTITKGSTPTSYGHAFVKTGINFIKVESIKNGRILSKNVTSFISEETHSFLARSQLVNGDILFSIAGSIGTCAVVTDDVLPANTNQALAIIRGTQLAYNPAFLLICIKSSVAQVILDKARGGAMNNVSLDDIQNFVIPLPPLAEQHRIVAKVDELMALCDQLEAAKTDREQSRDRLVAARLKRLNDLGQSRHDEVTAQSKQYVIPAGKRVSSAMEGKRQTLPGDWIPAVHRQSPTGAGYAGMTEVESIAFFLNHLPRITTRPAHITQLRQTILNLAVRGKLVAQEPNDEPVEELIRHRILKEKESIPFFLPETWVWATVGKIADSRLGKMLDKAKNRGKPRRYLRNINVRWFDFDLSNVIEMRFEDSELDEFALKRGDVLICEGGEPGRAAVWDERENDIYFQKAVHRVRFLKGVNPHYFLSVIREAADSNRLTPYFTGVGIKHFTGKGLSSFLVPLPPLAEQHRIVAKVDELMALCDQLENQLTSTEVDNRRLLEAVLHETLSPALAEAA